MIRLATRYLAIILGVFLWGMTTGCHHRSVDRTNIVPDDDAYVAVPSKLLFKLANMYNLSMPDFDGADTESGSVDPSSSDSTPSSGGASGIDSAGANTACSDGNCITRRDKPVVPARKRERLAIEMRKHFTFCPGYLRGNTRNRVVALTFDDGPSPYTAQILDVLAEEKVPGTFFVIGVNAQQYPTILRRIYQEGHVVGNHTYKHYNLARLNSKEAFNALARTSKIIRKQLGVYPRLYRSPYGTCNVDSRFAARGLGLVSVNWSASADDYHTQRTTPERIAEEIISLVRPGVIIDLHDGGGDRQKTVYAVRIIIQKLKAKGYSFVPLTELINQAPYYDDQYWRVLADYRRKGLSVNPSEMAKYAKFVHTDEPEKAIGEIGEDKPVAKKSVPAKSRDEAKGQSAAIARIANRSVDRRLNIETKVVNGPKNRPKVEAPAKYDESDIGYESDLNPRRSSIAKPTMSHEQLLDMVNDIASGLESSAPPPKIDGGR